MASRGFSLLAAEQTINLLEGDAAYSRLWRGLKAAGLDPADSFSFPINREVYPGLRPFEAEDAAAFFGRRHEIEQLIDLLHPTLQREPGRVVAIIGPSGSGKSSLLNAGLLPRLKRRDSPWIVVPTMLPGPHPLTSLARSLAGAYQQLGVTRDWADIETAISNGNGALREVTQDLLDRADDRSRVLLVIDQAEELLTRTGAEERRAFLGLVRNSLQEDVPLWVVQTVRSEFLSNTPERSGLAEVSDDSLVVEPLSPDRLPEVIEGPAALADLRFAPGLVQRMVADTAGASTACPSWRTRCVSSTNGWEPGGTVRIDDYEALGGVVGALQRRADQVLAELREARSRRHGPADADAPGDDRGLRRAHWAPDPAGESERDRGGDRRRLRGRPLAVIATRTRAGRRCRRAWSRSRTKRCCGNGPPSARRSRHPAPAFGCGLRSSGRRSIG